MPKGNDLYHATMTLEDAQAWCLAHDKCSGFTYQSTDPTPGGKVYVWFKSVDKVAPGAGWHSCVKGERAGWTERPHKPNTFARKHCGQMLRPDALFVCVITLFRCPCVARFCCAVGGPTSRADKAASSMLSLASVFSGGPKVPAAGSTKAVSAGLALLTRKPMHFEWWLHYHMALGVSHFFIHVEDTPELLHLLQREPYRSRVTVSEKGDNSSFKDNYWTLQDRQRFHVNQSLARCREMGIEWLFHVDDDELIWLDKPFREIVAAAPRGVTNITFTNLEAIPTTIEPVNYFEHIHSFTKKRMLAYVNGKPVGRTLSSVKLDGPHRFSARACACQQCACPAVHCLQSLAFQEMRSFGLLRACGRLARAGRAALPVWKCRVEFAQGGERRRE